MPAACASTTRWAWRGYGCCRTAPARRDGAYLHFPGRRHAAADPAGIGIATRRSCWGRTSARCPRASSSRSATPACSACACCGSSARYDHGLHRADRLGPWRGVDDQHARPAHRGRLVERAGHGVAAPARLSGRRGRVARGSERHRDRHLLWSAMLASGAAQGDPPPPDAPGPAVDAAIRHVGLAACAMTIVPLEDALGLVDRAAEPARHARRAPELARGACPAPPPRCWTTRPPPPVSPASRPPGTLT